MDSRTQKALSLCGILVPVVFISVVIILAHLTPGYSHMAHEISRFGEVGAPYALYQNLNFVFAGILATGFAVGLHRGLNEGNGSILGPALVGVFGIAALVGNGLFPLDQDPAAITTIMHMLLATIGFIAIAAGMYVLAARMQADPQWIGYGGKSKVWGVGTVLLFILWIGAGIAGFTTQGESPDGALQRLFVGWVMLWFLIMGAKLHQAS